MVGGQVVASALVASGFVDLALIEATEGRVARIEAYSLEGPRSVWSVAGVTDMYLLAGSERVFVLDNDEGQLSALLQHTGITAWRTSVPVHGYRFEAVSGGGVLFLAAAGELAALSVEDGHLLWKQQFPTGYVVNPAWLLGSSHVLQDRAALIYCDDTLYVRLVRLAADTRNSVLGASLLALNSSNGQEKWQFDFKVPGLEESGPPMAASRPAVDNDRLLLSDWSGQVYLLNARSGEVVWQRHAGFSMTTPVLAGRQACLVTDDQLSCLDALSGQNLWTMSMAGSRPITPLRLFGSTLLLGLDNLREGRTEIAFFSAVSGELVGSFQLPITDGCRTCIMAFEVVSGQLYVVQRQAVFAVDLAQFASAK